MSIVGCGAGNETNVQPVNVSPLPETTTTEKYNSPSLTESTNTFAIDSLPGETSKVPKNARFIAEEGDTAIYRKDGILLTEGILRGQFIEIQKGDYLHLIMKDSLNIYHSFFIFLDDTEKMNALWEKNYPEFNSRLRVHWKRQRIQLIDTEAKMTLYAVVKLEEE